MQAKRRRAVAGCENVCSSPVRIGSLVDRHIRGMHKWGFLWTQLTKYHLANVAVSKSESQRGCCDIYSNLTESCWRRMHR